MQRSGTVRQKVRWGSHSDRRVGQTYRFGKTVRQVVGHAGVGQTDRR